MSRQPRKLKNIKSPRQHGDGSRAGIVKMQPDNASGSAGLAVEGVESGTRERGEDTVCTCDWCQPWKSGNNSQGSWE